MLATITTRGRYGCPVHSPGPGVLPVVGPVVTLAFILPLAGPVPNVIQPPVPQSCQNAAPNVALQVQVVDQDGNPVDLSSALLLTLWLLAPGGAAVPVTAALVSNGRDGKLQYITNSGDLPQAGLWGVQAALNYGGNLLTTRWAYFAVEPNVVDL